MKLLGTKIVKVGDIDFPIKITNRAMIEYERLTGDTTISFNGTERLIQFFYCTAKAGAKASNIEFKYTYEEFLDTIDEYYTETLSNFSKALAEEAGDVKGKKQLVKS